MAGALGLFVLQIIGSRIWLTYAAFGPAEWLWRSGGPASVLLSIEVREDGTLRGPPAQPVRQFWNRSRAHDRRSLQDAFTEVREEIRHQYLLTYVPARLEKPGTWRPLSVRVRCDGCRVRSRTGYRVESPRR